jgi:hypothetical protein
MYSSSELYGKNYLCRRMPRTVQNSLQSAFQESPAEKSIA